MSDGYALKFISGKYQGGEFPLKGDKQLVIGRSSELDMVLVEDMVSRKHAKIALHRREDHHRGSRARPTAPSSTARR